jgi:hypothetical protein
MTEEKKAFDPADFPALQDFLPAYLHEDFGEEYGSPAGALQAFLADASGDQILEVKEDWKRFRKAFAHHPLAATQAALVKLGGGWRPETEAELKGMDEILSRAEA